MLAANCLALIQFCKPRLPDESRMKTRSRDFDEQGKRVEAFNVVGGGIVVGISTQVIAPKEDREPLKQFKQKDDEEPPNDKRKVPATQLTHTPDNEAPKSEE